MIEFAISMLLLFGVGIPLITVEIVWLTEWIEHRRLKAELDKQQEFDLE